ncbi:MAG TPA: serine/threonine-protein kinase, partial [Gemmata sp.]|nr:serine/threonine-protein kinase [Gemmata sp.]
MPSLPPDPTGRPSTAKRAPEDVAFPTGESPSNAPHPEVESKASTNSHHPAASVPVVSAGLNTANESPAPSPAVSSDILSLLNNPGFATGAAALENTDDSPTVITRGIGDRPPPPAPLHVLADNPPQLAGRRLGHYELIESIGAGGMATVLKARDLELGRIVALKILPPTAARDAESVTRFKQEARAAALLDHENIARVYACGEDQGLHFIAFEFVEGINLRQMIERRQTIPPIEAVRYMIQVAAGLAHAAERGVVHRDIKPSNILITPDGRAKIVDMGLARQLEAGANGG